MHPVKILLIEDNPGDARLIQEMLSDAKNIDFVIDWKQTLKSGLDILRVNKYDVVLLDLGLPDSPNRSTSFSFVQVAVPNIPVLILTGLDDEAGETFALTSITRSPQGYLVKGRIDTGILVGAIRCALPEHYVTPVLE